jgi:hypothetical protein
MLRTALFASFVTCVMCAQPASAQTDIAGEWSVRIHEDQPHRMPGPRIGDYTGVPLTDAARLRADSWDASIHSLREHQTKQYTSLYFCQAIGNLRITKVVDPTTQQVVAYTSYSSPGIGVTRTIWMDGRPAPAAFAAHTWQGFSRGQWAGPALIVATSHVKAGTLQRNGVPHSDRARLTEHFIRHATYLTVIAIVEDPIYLEEPLIRTCNFSLDPDQRLEPVPAQVVDELPSLAKGAIPHHLPGANPYLREFAEAARLPDAAVRGGAHTLYPEFQRTMQGTPVP